MGLGSWLAGIFGGGKEKDGDECVACGSTSLTTLAPDVYRCDSCGYEGGAGLPAYIASRKKAQYQTESSEVLLNKLAEEFESGRLTLLAAPGISAQSGQGGMLGGSSVTQNEDGSVTRTSWSINVGVSGDNNGGLFAQADEAERMRLMAERENAIAAVRQQLLDTLPVFEVLVEKGHSDLQTALKQVRQLEGNKNAGLVAGVLADVGPVVAEG